MRAQKQQSLQPYKWVYLFSKSTSARLSWGNLLPLEPTINGCWGQMRRESNLLVGKGEPHQFHGDPMLPVPALAPHGGEGLCREHPRSWDGRPGPDLASGMHSMSLLKKWRCWECSHSSSTPKWAVQRVGLSSLIPLDVKTRRKNKSGLETEGGFKTKISDPDCKNAILQRLLGFRALTGFTKSFGTVSWLCITFLALILGWGWVQKRC